MVRAPMKRTPAARILVIVTLVAMIALPTLIEGHSVPAYGEENANANIEISYIPRLDLGEDLEATISLANREPREIDVALLAYDRDGSSLGLILDATQLSPAKVKNLDTYVLPPDTASLRVESNGNLLGILILKSIDNKKSEAIPAIKESSQQLDFPTLLEGDTPFKLLTLLNPNAVPASIAVVALDSSGHELARNILPHLSPMESRNLSLLDIFAGTTLRDLSTIRVESDTKIIGIQLVDYPDGDLVGLPALNVTSRGWVFPIFRQGGQLELWTSVSIFNPQQSYNYVIIEAFDGNNDSLGIIDMVHLSARTAYSLSTEDQRGVIPSDAVSLKVTSDQPISGYEVIGVVNGTGLTAVLGIPEEDQTRTGFEIVGSRDRSLLSAYPMVRIGDGGIKSMAGSLGNKEWKKTNSF